METYGAAPEWMAIWETYGLCTTGAGFRNALRGQGQPEYGTRRVLVAASFRRSEYQFPRYGGHIFQLPMRTPQCDPSRLLYHPAAMTDLTPVTLPCRSLMVSSPLAHVNHAPAKLGNANDLMSRMASVTFSLPSLLMPT